MSMWVYAAGETDGRGLKVGVTSDATCRARIAKISRDGNNDTYVLLAAVRGNRKDEAAILDYFRAFRDTGKGSRTEYLLNVAETREYANWLRTQWFATVDPDEPADPDLVRPFEEWMPTPERREPLPQPDPGVLVQEWDTYPGGLAGTYWAGMKNPAASFQDYFTPSHIVDAAREAMDGIDLDAASHYAANKVHRIPRWFDTTRSAFENPWAGRVWLNPPYGENAQWFAEIERWVEAGEVTQLCMISPVWAFTTKIARPVIELTSAMVLLVPTPKFWGNKNPARTGTNNPHAIIYIGAHPSRFRDAYAPYGVAFKPDWGDAELVPEHPEQP